MAGVFDRPDGSAFLPLERVSDGVVPNDRVERRKHFRPRGERPARFVRHGYIATPHPTTSRDPVQWFNPDDSSRRAIRKHPQRQRRRAHSPDGLRTARFRRRTSRSPTGRSGDAQQRLHRVRVVDNQPKSVCDYAGFAPLASVTTAPEGSSREAFEDLLRKVRKDRIVARSAGTIQEAADRSQHRDRDDSDSYGRPSIAKCVRGGT